MNEQENFNYTYSASTQKEIKKIRDKYTTSTESESKIEQLRKLDKSVTKPGFIVSMTLGILSSLILGAGMSMCMVWKSNLFIPGIIVGLVGILGILCAYPIYNAITKKRRAKLAPEIIRLSNELM